MRVHRCAEKVQGYKEKGSCAGAVCNISIRQIGDIRPFPSVACGASKVTVKEA
jgi:hypothetical protein